MKFGRKDPERQEPVWPERPRVNLPKLEADINPRQFAPARTIQNMVEELAHHYNLFQSHVQSAFDAASAYCATHAELSVEVDAKLQRMEETRKELERLRDTLPKPPGGEDEIDHSDSLPVAGDSTSNGKVESGSVTKLPNPRRF